MSMTDRTYHLSVDEMQAFIVTLEGFMAPFKSHTSRFLLLLEKMNEKCFKVSSIGIQTTLQSVGIFPDLRDACMESLEGFAALCEIQEQICETTGDINSDIMKIYAGYIELLKTLQPKM